MITVLVACTLYGSGMLASCVLMVVGHRRGQQ